MAGIETAKYDVVKKDGNIEIRSYDHLITAAVVDGNVMQNNGFSTIFNYISGDNEKREKISMTTPVINEMEDEVTTEFVMPKKFKKEDLPQPKNKNVILKETPARLVLAIRFNGMIKMERIRFYEKVLLDYAKDHRLEVLGTVKLARYNPPMVPGFLRRNELLIDLKNEDNATDEPRMDS